MKNRRFKEHRQANVEDSQSDKQFLPNRDCARPLRSGLPRFRVAPRVGSESALTCVSFPVATSNHPETDYKNKDWVFINYTYKRFEGLTARGAIPSYMKAAK